VSIVLAFRVHDSGAARRWRVFFAREATVKPRSATFEKPAMLTHAMTHHRAGGSAVHKRRAR